LKEPVAALASEFASPLVRANRCVSVDDSLERLSQVGCTSRARHRTRVPRRGRPARARAAISGHIGSRLQVGMCLIPGVGRRPARVRSEIPGSCRSQASSYRRYGPINTGHLPVRIRSIEDRRRSGGRGSNAASWHSGWDPVEPSLERKLCEVDGRVWCFR